jgi:hypothetical protein
VVQTPPLPGIAEVAQPELKLAGLRINPRTCSSSRFSFGTDLSLLDVGTRKESRIRGLPRGLRLADLSWSPDQRYLAFPTWRSRASAARWSCGCSISKNARRASCRRSLCRPCSRAASTGCRTAAACWCTGGLPASASRRCRAASRPGR